MLPVLSGVLLTLSFPSFGHAAFAWIALLPLLVAISRVSSIRAAFQAGLVTGVVHFLGTIYWLPRVMVEFGGLPVSAAWAVHLAFVVYLAMFPALFAAALWTIRDRFGPRGLLWTPVVWVTSELGRIYLFTGFPWELLGYSQTPFLAVAQLASLVGVLGISALVALVNGTLAFAVVGGGRRRWVPMAMSAVLLVGCAMFGTMRIRSESLLHAGESIRVSAVQGNVAQREKWNPALGDTILQKYLDLTRRAVDDGAELVIWPEAATPFAFRDDRRGDVIRELARERRVHVLFGTTDNRWRPGEEPRSYNAAVMVGPDGDTTGTYYKQHLVPWGEYVPLRDLLFFVSPLVEGVGGFSEGTEASTFPVKGHRIGTAICYEIIYPGLVREFVTGGSRLLTTVTNDAWYGPTSAPYQHFQMATMRAIEGGRFLVRAANTGISGVVDPYGRVVTRTALFEEDVVTADVRLLDHSTVYSRIGDVPAFGCGALTLGLLGLAWRFRAM